MNFTFFRHYSIFWRNFKDVTAYTKFSLRDRILRLFMRFFLWCYRIFPKIWGYSDKNCEFWLPEWNWSGYYFKFLRPPKQPNGPKMCSKMLGSNYKLLESISQSRKHIFWLFTRHDSSKIDDFIDIVGLEGGGDTQKRLFHPKSSFFWVFWQVRYRNLCFLGREIRCRHFYTDLSKFWPRFGGLWYSKFVFSE